MCACIHVHKGGGVSCIPSCPLRRKRGKKGAGCPPFKHCGMNVETDSEYRTAVDSSSPSDTDNPVQTRSLPLNAANLKKLNKMHSPKHWRASNSTHALIKWQEHTALYYPHAIVEKKPRST